MNPARRQSEIEIPLGIGFYTVPEASRLLKVPSISIRRWLDGYRYEQSGKTFDVPPLWTPQLPKDDHHIELGFRDLIELRFVYAFTKAGLGLKTIRHCIKYARDCVNDERPFSTRRFQTDGRTIFLDSVHNTGEQELLDLKTRQFVLKQIIERTFKDLDIENDTVSRWRPYRGKDSIVIDPTRAFGQPIASKSGVPTTVLADALSAEKSIDRVSRLYEVSAAVIRDAVKFEEYLQAA